MKVTQFKLNDKEYPEILRDIPSPPKQLYVLGDLEALLAKPRLSVVGSRRVTPYGRAITSDLVQTVARQGIVIVSGLAFGVDSIAHQAALDAGGGTIAVLPCGIEKVYPSSHAQLARDILAKGGALVSEYPGDTLPGQYNFIERNRIVSGLGDGTLITEAAVKSGTLHTANFALEQGRTVMAVPGNITSPLSQGTNNLVKSGATMVTDASDILFALGFDPAKHKQQELFGSTKEETLLLTLLQGGISDSSILLVESGLSPVAFNQTLTMLEINAQIRPLGAGHWAIK